MIGYTHYWSIEKPFDIEQRKRIVNEVEHLFTILPIECQLGFTVVSTECITFNDFTDPLRCQRFYFDYKSKDKCRTNRRNYDLVVCVVLLIIENNAYKSDITEQCDCKSIYPSLSQRMFRIRSDGVFFARNCEWDKAKKLYVQHRYLYTRNNQESTTMSDEDECDTLTEYTMSPCDLYEYEAYPKRQRLY